MFAVFSYEGEQVTWHYREAETSILRLGPYFQGGSANCVVTFLSQAPFRLETPFYYNLPYLAPNTNVCGFEHVLNLAFANKISNQFNKLICLTNIDLGWPACKFPCTFAICSHAKMS